MNEQAIVYDIRAATADDIPGLLALQAENQISRGGALSIEFPATWFADVICDMPIVTAWREHRLVGFLVSSPKGQRSIFRSAKRSLARTRPNPTPIILGHYASLPRNEGRVWSLSCSTCRGCSCRAARAWHSFAGTTRLRAPRDLRRSAPEPTPPSDHTTLLLFVFP